MSDTGLPVHIVLLIHIKRVRNSTISSQCINDAYKEMQRVMQTASVLEGSAGCLVVSQTSVPILW